MTQVPTSALIATAPDELQARARFALGRVVATRGALALLNAHGVTPLDLLARHASGHDWGDICAEDAAANDQALMHGDRLLSCYTLVPGVADARVWIITEWDRSVTTVLRPDEY